LVKRGYSLEDIEKMEIEEYDFVVNLVMELNSKRPDTPFGGL
jgi:hypothetical protein